MKFGWSAYIANSEIQLPSAITIAPTENSLASGDPRNSRYNFCLISGGHPAQSAVAYH